MAHTATSIDDDVNGLPLERRVTIASPSKRPGGTVVERKGSPGIHESWVRPDGTIERNIKLDLVVSAAKKRLRSP